VDSSGHPSSGIVRPPQ